VLVLAALLAACIQDSTVVPPPPAPPDSSPFRRGQWAAQFGAGFSSASFGFLTFRSSQRAWVLDIRINGGHGESLVTDSSGTHFAGLNSRATVDLRLGVRRHQTGGKVIPFYSVGIFGGLTHATSTAPGFGSDGNGWSAGLFGEIGGCYMITPNLALAATGAITLRYATETSEQTGPFGTQKLRRWDLSGSTPGGTLLVMLFF
jgi:hypothetical protein